MSTTVRTRAPRTRFESWFVATCLVTGVSAVLALTHAVYWHWFLIPTTIAGILAAVDAVDWSRGRLDALEPRALVGLFATHLLYVVPLLHIGWDYWPEFVRPAADWRHSLGVLGCVNVAGMLIYRFVVSTRSSKPNDPTPLELDERRFATWCHMAIGLSMAALAYVVLRSGGISGYLSTVSSDRDNLAGLGPVLIVAEAWPLILFALILVRRRDWYRSHTGALVLLLLAFVVCQFLVSGLRGSRANTVWPTLIAVGMIHLLVVQVSRRTLAVCAVVLVGFMWLYGFYKSQGTEVLDLIQGRTTTAALESESGRTLDGLLLEDFGRAGIQAVVVDRLEHGAQDLAHGATYLGDFNFLMPGSVALPFPDKVEAGTDVLYGPGTYASGISSSRIYGLAGEGMLNFGIWGAALPFVALGLFVRWATRLHERARKTHGLSVSLMVPILGPAALLLLGSDLGNFAWFMAKHALPLGVIIYLSRVRTPARSRRPVPASRGLSSGRWPD